jgi:uncharacterized membrane protein
MAQPNPQPAVNSNNTIWIYLSYILGWLFGLIGLAVVKDDEFIRFHCAQALVYSAIVFIADIILSFTIVLPFIIWPLSLVYAIIIMLKAAKGEKAKIPFCGDFAEKNLMKLFK